MIQLAWPEVLLVAPLPWLLRRWLPPVERTGGAALRVPFLADFEVPATTARRRIGSAPWVWLAALAWLLLVLASARPQRLGEPIELPLSGRDLMLAVDLSGSMEERDFRLGGLRVDRLTAARSVAGDFLARRTGDRVGLILFGEQAYLQAPLTFDRDTVRQLLDESAIGLAGRATAIGDAIGLAIKRLREVQNEQRVLILMTDGANTAGAVDPLQAAGLAADNGVTIYTIGIGADAMMVRDFFGARRVNPSAELDEESLKAIAQRTGGRYFRARDTDELEQIYAILDELEPVQSDQRLYRPLKALYHWPLAAALLLAVLLWVARARTPA